MVLSSVDYRLTLHVFDVKIDLHPCSIVFAPFDGCPDINVQHPSNHCTGKPYYCWYALRQDSVLPTFDIIRRVWMNICRWEFLKAVHILRNVVVDKPNPGHVVCVGVSMLSNFQK